MESIQELTAEFLLANSKMREAVEKTKTPDTWGFGVECSNITTDFDYMLRMMIISQAYRLMRRANEFNENKKVE